MKFLRTYIRLFNYRDIALMQFARYLLEKIMGITKKELHQEEINVLATLFKVLGHPARLTILKLIKERSSVTVGQLVDSIGGLAQSTVSEHLNELKRLSLIKGVQIGTSIQYELHQDTWPVLKDILRGCAEEF